MNIIWGGKKFRYFVILLFFLIILSFFTVTASAKDHTIEIDISGEKWEFLRWYEIININEEGNSDFRCVVSFLFTNKTIDSSIYRLIITLKGDIKDLNIHHPFYQTENEYLFNYSVNELADTNPIN